jgi:predicted dehydrogenase
MPRTFDQLVAEADAVSVAGWDFSWLEGYQDCFNLFVADVYHAVRTGAPPDGLPLFSDGLQATTIHAAVAASVLSGSWVDVPAPTGGRQ